jgi:hypothetical protein
MKFLGGNTKVEMSTASGVFRVNVRPVPTWLSVFVEAAICAAFSWYAIRNWGGLPIAFRILLIWAIARTAMDWPYQFTGREIIEFDSISFRIRKYILGWEKTKNYSTKQCRELELHRGANKDRHRLQCKVGWRTVTFGKYLSEEQALEILTELQCRLPDVARELGMNLNRDKRNFTTLGLESGRSI